ncbi:hypothetical protein L5849_03365 [Erythrobacter sp. SN021]|uniref:hypothetical protein n=1 Tax=Erythrobacter sp. SN021 TaxID=2912574 RepID=UPI001F4789C6|nr:hypothetical protein [Erythrobacter sp. SN021]MCF8881734.1 hypothetical protein [Erythrobacter sp. SN021]
MSLIEDLGRARTEEDVKDAYIKALGLKGVFKGLVDIQTPEIWFEAKEAATPPLLMFAQLLTYVRAARKRGEAIPGFLCVIDREKAALMATEHALPILEDKAIQWPKSGSAADKALAAQIAPVIETHFVLYQIDGYEAEFIKATKDAVREGRIIRTPITPDNLRQVFDKWVAMVGVELGVKREADYAVLFFADIMHDGRNEAMRNLPARLLFSGDKPVFILGAEQYDLASERGYRNFWNIYHRPPEQKHRHYLLERRDSLLPMDDQKFKGAFYTPLHIVDKAYDQLAATLGADWQQKYIVWDMCAGVGNLEAKHSNLRNVFMSTLDAEDVTIMRSNPAFAGAEIFQYDYLNDDVTDFGEIDYELSGKVPQSLRDAIVAAREGKKGAKPVLVLINPPYAEAMNVDNRKDEGAKAGIKQGVSKTRISHGMDHLGYAARELFVQFLHRIMIELPRSKVAIFSKLKYVNAPNFALFRDGWTAKYLDGFVVHSLAFDGLKGNFPIGFLSWDLAVEERSEAIDTIALDRSGAIIDSKVFYRVPPREPLADWIIRPRSNSEPALPLQNALVPTTRTNDVRGRYWADGAIGSMICKGNDFQNAGNATALLSSGYNSAGAFFVTEENLWQAAIVFAVRRVIKPTWLNDRDQFLQPSQPLSDEFKSDCLVWMLFNGSNLTAGADGLRWNDRDWSLTNHFIPFTEAEVGAKARFESDFMVRYMTGMASSPEAQAVLDEGCKLFQRFHATQFPNKIRKDLKLNRADAGWYQVRRALEAYGDIELTDFDPFKAAYASLTEKLRPLVYELGFLAT